MDQREVVIITGSSGHIGTALIHRIAADYRIAGLDEPGPPLPVPPAQCIEVDLFSFGKVKFGAGALVSKYWAPALLDASYGASPSSYMIFFRAKLARK